MTTQTRPKLDLYADRRIFIITSITIVLGIAILSTVLRLVARRIQKTQYNASDLVIVVALICAMCKAALIYAGQPLALRFERSS